jgi:coenzyme F420-reducing hydrogenase beta subunit
LRFYFLFFVSYFFMSEWLSPKDIVQSGMCIGCGSCAAQNGGAMQWDEEGFWKPDKKVAWYGQKSEAFTRTCPFSPGAKNEDYLANTLYPAAPQRSSGLGRFETAYVGYVAEDGFRMQGSSGGMVSWVAAELMRRGEIDGVAHVVPVVPVRHSGSWGHEPGQKGVVPVREDTHRGVDKTPVHGDTNQGREENRFFKFRISRTGEEINEGAKSRYYPVNLAEVLEVIKETPGRYAIVGIPCFIKAINLLRQQDAVFAERIRYTLGLFCGHMKSARFVESFAWQLGVPFPEVQKVEYRYKDPNRPANWYTAMLTMPDGKVVSKDWWHLVDGDWGAGFFMNSACNWCDDVVGETADISFGDAWVEPYASDGRGTNAAVVRSPLIRQYVQEAIAEGRLCLEEKDAAYKRRLPVFASGGKAWLIGLPGQKRVFSQSKGWHPMPMV